MVAPQVGQVVLVPFPFSDLSASKRRPALIIANAGRGDFICAQITSNPYADDSAIELTDISFKQGSLQRVSYFRPGKLFTANQSLFLSELGALQDTTLSRCRDAVIALFR